MHAQLLLIGKNGEVEPAWRGRVVNPEIQAQQRRRVGNRAAPGLKRQPQAVRLRCCRPAPVASVWSLSASESRQQKQLLTAPRILFFFFLISLNPVFLEFVHLKQTKVIFFISSKSTLFRIRQYSKSTKLTSSFQRERLVHKVFVQDFHSPIINEERKKSLFFQ